MNVRRIARLLGAVILANAGYQLGDWQAMTLNLSPRWQVASTLTGMLLGALAGLLFTPQLTIVPFNKSRRALASIAAGDLVAGGVGLLIGLLVSVLIAFVLHFLPGIFGNITPLIAAAVVTYFAITVMVSRHREMAEYVTERKFLSGAPRNVSTPREHFLLDTSVVIDGRIADIASTGFLSGVLIVPDFVLKEIQNIADSADSLRRNRGRRGLDVLARLQEETSVQVDIVDIHEHSQEDVDSRLVLLARERGYPIITNDYNLNKVAALQGVKILNVNELARSVRPIVLPGEDVSVRIIQEGKEYNQGVGYLDDGTMVVVENGRRVMHTDVDVTVTRVLQTTAGRMIFAQLAPDHHS